MKERPIIFSAPMVRAIIEGRKTMTRRACQGRGVRSFGKAGDRLWVRETFRLHDNGSIEYRADTPAFADHVGPRWRSPLYMPRWAARRITLEITELRVERLQEISEADCFAEGISGVKFRPDDGFPLCIGYTAEPDNEHNSLSVDPQTAYANLWDGINGPGSWDSNPWVWGVAFSVIGGQDQ